MPLIEDDWLAAQLGRPVFRQSGAVPDRLPPGFVYAKVPVEESARLCELQQRGFSLVSTTVSLDCGLPLRQVGAAVTGMRMARHEDEAAVARIARDSFSFDHFHCDPAFPQGVCDRLKESWARNFFAGARGHWMVVADTGSGPSGFLLLMDSDGRLVIDLIAVAEHSRGVGLARNMILYGARVLDRYRTMIVSTQLSNVASVRLYESLGFRMTGAEHVLHHHAGPIAEGGTA